MEDINDILNYLNNDLERKLYCIKINNYIFDLEFEKKYKFKFQSNISIDGAINILLEDNFYIFEKHNRIIDFKIDGNSQKRFVYSSDYLQQIFAELKIEYYSSKGEISDKSLDSEISEGEIYNIFVDEKIVTIYKIKSKIDKFIDEFFVHKNNYFFKKISDLSINAKFYYPENYDDNLDISIFDEYYPILKKFRWNDAKILYLIGPKGTSKSIFLMYSFMLENFVEIPVLYINYKVLNKLELKERKNIFKKEMIYLFFKKEVFKDFYRTKIYKKIKSNNNLMLCLKDFLEEILKIYKNYFFKKISIIIDNYDENDENMYDDLEKLINLVNESTIIKLIISGNSKFLNNKLKLFIENKKLTNETRSSTNENITFLNAIDGQILLYYYPKIKTEKENIKSLPLFYYRKIINNEELEKQLLKDELEYCDKFNILGMQYSLMNYQKDIELKELISYYDILPIEYLRFQINNNNSISFEFQNPLFLKAIKKKIRVNIKENSLLFLLSKEKNERILKGIFEEKLLILLISYNKLNLKDFNVFEENFLEIEKIAEFKNSSYNKINNKINENSPIIITQENFRDEHYDLLILIPNKVKDKNYKAFLIQIGLNKTKVQIEKVKKDFDDNKNNYIKGIEKFIDIIISEIELIFIFDKESQINLEINNTNINEFGAKYCIQNNIKFYLFSIKDYTLYLTLNAMIFDKVSKFGNFNPFYKRNWNDYLKGLKSTFLSEEEKIAINKEINDDIENYSFTMDSDIEEYPKNINKEHIYILKNNMNTFYIINSQLYIFEKDSLKLRAVPKTLIKKKEVFTLIDMHSKSLKKK